MVGGFQAVSPQETLHGTQVSSDGGFQAVFLAGILFFGQFIVLRKKLKETWRASICDLHNSSLGILRKFFLTWEKMF